MTASLTLLDGDYLTTAEETTGFFECLVDYLQGLPEVEAAAVMSKPPGIYMGHSSYILAGQSFANENK